MDQLAELPARIRAAVIPVTWQSPRHYSNANTRLGPSGAAGDLWGAYDDRRAFRRKLAQTSHVLQPPFALIEPVMVDRKVRAHTRIKAERVGSNPFDLTPLLKELDCLHVETREVVTALVIQTEKLAGIVYARLPPAEEGDHGASRHRPVFLFPGLKVIRRQLSIRLDRGPLPNIHHDQRPNQLFGGNK